MLVFADSRLCRAGLCIRESFSEVGAGRSRRSYGFRNGDGDMRLEKKPPHPPPPPPQVRLTSNIGVVQVYVDG